MEITKTSPVTGLERTLDLDITQGEYDNWKSGVLIQDAMPNLSADDREFLISGILPEEFDELFEPEIGDFDDDENDDTDMYDDYPFDGTDDDDDLDHGQFGHVDEACY